MKRHPYRAAFAATVVTLLVACSGPTAGPVATPADTAAAAKATLDAVMQADRDFAAAALKDGLKPAFLAYLTPDSEFIDASGMIKGADKIVAGFEGSPPDFKIEWTPDGGQPSTGDLATTTGRYTVKAGDTALDTGRYLTVWRKDAVGAWKVVTDVTVSDAPAQPTAPDPNGRPG